MAGWGMVAGPDMQAGPCRQRLALQRRRSQRYVHGACCCRRACRCCSSPSQMMRAGAGGQAGRQIFGLAEHSAAPPTCMLRAPSHRAALTVGGGLGRRAMVRSWPSYAVATDEMLMACAGVAGNRPIRTLRQTARVQRPRQPTDLAAQASSGARAPSPGQRSPSAQPGCGRGRAGGGSWRYCAAGQGLAGRNQPSRRPGLRNGLRAKGGGTSMLLPRPKAARCCRCSTWQSPDLNLLAQQTHPRRRGA